MYTVTFYVCGMMFKNLVAGEGDSNSTQAVVLAVCIFKIAVKMLTRTYKTLI